MVIGQVQCFLIAVLIGAVVGVRRGWNREVITAAIILATTLLLTLGGADLLASWLSHGIVGTAHAEGIPYSGGPQPTTPPPYPLPNATSSQAGSGCSLAASAPTLATVIFAGMCWLAYAVGKKYGAPPKTHNHRLAGAIPGAINGACIAYFASRFILPGQPVLVNTPTPAAISSYLPVVLGLGLLGLLAVLFIAAQASKGNK